MWLEKSGPRTEFWDTSKRRCQENEEELRRSSQKYKRKTQVGMVSWKPNEGSFVKRGEKSEKGNKHTVPGR